MRLSFCLIALLGIACSGRPSADGPEFVGAVAPGRDAAQSSEPVALVDAAQPAGEDAAVAPAPDAGVASDAATVAPNADASTEVSPADALAAAQATIEAMCTSGYESDPGECQRMKQICSAGTAREPYLSEEWRFTCQVAGCTDVELKGRYYLVPFDDAQGTTGCIISINVDMTFDKPGAWMSVRYGEPIQYLPISESDAQGLLAAELAKQNLSGSVGAGLLQDNPATIECGWSLDFPCWRFDVDGAAWYVTQAGAATQKIALGQAGGAGSL